MPAERFEAPLGTVGISFEPSSAILSVSALLTLQVLLR